MTALQPASFEVERFELARDARLEVHGRWYGVRGRRFMRPTLTAVAAGREQRLLALLEHKPWVAEEGEEWLAAFPWSQAQAALLHAELTVAPDVTVPLPRPSSPARAVRRRSGSGGSPAQKPEVRDQALPELEMRVADLRAEAERGRAAARLAAQIARERDRADAERVEAIRERDAVRAERDAARRQCNRMLADRDSARTRSAEAIRQWEQTAALGTRRTQERDAATSERDRLAHERDSALGQRARSIRERDSAVEQRVRAIQERDSGLEQRARAIRERDSAVEQRDRAVRERDSALAQSSIASEGSTDLLATPVGTGSAVRAPASSARRTAARSEDARTARRPRWPPAPAETNRRDHQGDGPESRSAARPLMSPAAGMWPARLLAIAALLVAFGILIVPLFAK